MLKRKTSALCVRKMPPTAVVVHASADNPEGDRCDPCNLRYILFFNDLLIDAVLA